MNRVVAIVKKRFFSNSFSRNSSWFAIAELSNKLFRGVVVNGILSSLFSIREYGVLSVLLPLGEIIGVLQGKAGFNSKLISCDEESFPQLANTTYYLGWIVALVLTVLQMVVGALLLLLSAEGREIGMGLIFLSFSYLLYPIYAVNTALIYRSNNLTVLARLNLFLGITSGLSTLVLAINKLSYWAVVIPLLANSLVWALVIPKISKWDRGSIGLEGAGKILSYSLGLMFAELLDKVRANIDYLIVGIFLGINNQGLYFFGFNWGLNLAIGLLNSYSYSFYPNLIEANQRGEIEKEYWAGVKKMLKSISLMTLIQVIGIPIFIKITTGDKWNAAIPVVIMVGLSAIPRVLKIATGALLQLRRKTNLLFYLDLMFTGALVTAIVSVVPFGINYVALVVMLVHWVCLPIYFLFVSKRFL